MTHEAAAFSSSSPSIFRTSHKGTPRVRIDVLGSVEVDNLA